MTLRLRLSEPMTLVIAYLHFHLDTDALRCFLATLIIGWHFDQGAVLSPVVPATILRNRPRAWYDLVMHCAPLLGTMIEVQGPHSRPRLHVRLRLRGKSL